MNIKSLLTRKNKATVKTQSDKTNVPYPTINGKWKLMLEGTVLGRVRIVTSQDKDFAFGQKMFQVYDDQDKRYGNVAFVQNDGSPTFFKNTSDEQKDVVNTFLQLLEEGGEINGVTVVESHNDAGLYETPVGKALLGWKRNEH